MKRTSLVKFTVIITFLFIILGCAAIEDAKERRDGNPNPHLIRDCPEIRYIDRILNPNTNQSGAYYIYKGERRELYEFDNEWIEIYCYVKTIRVS